MSLLIASSSEGVNDTNQIGVSVPYQFRNHLKSPLIIEPFSEIAVESVKLNRVPQIDYEGGLVTNFWFGERLSEFGLDNSLSYFIPSENIIAEGSAPLDFADKFKKILQQSYSLHPEIDSQNIQVNILVDTLGGFTGFEFKIPQVGSAQTVSTIPPAATRTEIDETISDGDLDWDGATLSCSNPQSIPANFFNGVSGQLMPINDEGGPISLHNGSLTYSGMTSAQWTLGLSRPLPLMREDHAGVLTFGQPPRDLYYGGDEGSQVGPLGDTIMDFCAQVGEDDYLRLYHLVADTSNDENGIMVMDEIKYYENTDSAFSASNGSNSSFVGANPIPSASISDITFICRGEELEVQASGNTVVRTIKLNASIKGQVPKPIGQTCWKMYPTVHLWDENDAVDIAVYQCRTNSTIYCNQPENAWALRCISPTILGSDGFGVDVYDQLDAGVEELPPWNNALRWPKDVDTRPAYMIHNANSKNAFSSIVRTPKGFTSNAIVEDYENIFIMGKSERYMPRRIQGWQPNSTLTLGFNPFAINSSSNMLHGAFDGASFQSATRPSMVSQQSTFVRVPTLTHETYNFGTGNPSKILFQVPRFDNSGVETGALFFQNPDKTYIDLKNTSELRITDLDVHFVRKNEKFAKDLTGSSEVVFHVRKRPKM
jgi:hypothetical protein